MIRSLLPSPPPGQYPTPRVIFRGAEVSRTSCSGLQIHNASPVPGFAATTVRVWPTVRDDVRVTVHDNGAGIPPSDMPRIFEPFFTTRHAQGGAGLGLTLCRQIVNGILGGRIELVSPPDAGTTVTVTLPRRAPRQPA